MLAHRCRSNHEFQICNPLLVQSRMAACGFSFIYVCSAICTADLISVSCFKGVAFSGDVKFEIVPVAWFGLVQCFSVWIVWHELSERQVRIVAIGLQCFVQMLGGQATENRIFDFVCFWFWTLRFLSVCLHYSGSLDGMQIIQCWGLLFCAVLYTISLLAMRTNISW